MKEIEILRAIQLDLGSRADIRLFRNNVGVLQDKNGQYVQYGLCPGSADLIGWKSVEITPQMIGERVAVFTAIEVKSLTGKLSTAQRNFLAAVGLAGGIGEVASSIEDACQALNIPVKVDL